MDVLLEASVNIGTNSPIIIINKLINCTAHGCVTRSKCEHRYKFTIKNRCIIDNFINCTAHGCIVRSKCEHRYKFTSFVPLR